MLKRRASNHGGSIGFQDGIGRAYLAYLPWLAAYGYSSRESTKGPLRGGRGRFASRSSKRGPAAACPWSSSRPSTRSAITPTATGSWRSTNRGYSISKVYFSIRSHGYEAEKDGFGYRGAAFVITEGGTAQVVIHRLNIARRLYRVTGEGIYRDSVLTGDKVPIREPLLERPGLRPGQRCELRSFRERSTGSGAIRIVPTIPLGNFHVPGATSELPGRGGLEPETGVDLTYFVDDNGFARPTAPMPGEGPTWLSGLTVLEDASGRERMFAFYAKIRKHARSLRARARRVQSADQAIRESHHVSRTDRVFRRAPRRSSILAPGQWNRLYLLC